MWLLTWLQSLSSHDFLDPITCWGEGECINLVTKVMTRGSRRQLARAKQ